MLARADTERYREGSKVFQNAVATKTSSCKTRGGLQRLGMTYGGERARLIPYRTKNSGSYIIEITDGGLRAWNSTTLEVEPGSTMSAPWTISQALEIHYKSSDDLLFLTQGDVEPQVLTLVGSTWTLESLGPGPALNTEFKDILLRTEFEAFDLDYAIYTGAQFEEVPYFSQDDVQSYFRIGSDGYNEIEVAREDYFGGWSKIIEFTNSEQVQSDRLDVTPRHTVATSNWQGPFVRRQNIETLRFINDNSFEPGEVETIRAIDDDDNPVPGYFKPEWMGSLIDLNGDGRRVFYLFDVRESGAGAAGYAVRVEGGSSFPGTVGSPFVGARFYDPQERDTDNRALQPSDSTGNISVYSNKPVFNADFVGLSLTLNGGVVEVTGFVSEHEVTATVTDPLLARHSDSTWGLSWSDATGYPTTCGIHQDRLWLGGIRDIQRTVWGSVTGKYRDFTLGPADNDAVAYEFTGNDVDKIRWIESASDVSERGSQILAVGTDEAEYSVTGLPLTPSTVGVQKMSSYGSRPVQPTSAETGLLFAQYAGTSLYDMRFFRDVEGFLDVAAHADPFSSSRIKEMAWVREPDSTLVTLLEDGSVWGCTIRRNSNHFAWSNWTGILASSVASMPGEDNDDCWVCVQRADGWSVERYTTEMKLDSWVETASSSVNLQHLAGQTVTTYDKTNLSRTSSVVPGNGVLDLGSAPSSTVCVGLPVSMRVDPLLVEYQDNIGATMGRGKNVANVFLNLAGYNGDLTVGGFRVKEKMRGNEGWYEVGHGSFDVKTSIPIECNHPLGVEILAVVGESGTRGR